MAEKKRPRRKKASKTYRIEFTRLSLFLWGSGVLFGLFWIFVFGILVGRGFLPDALTDLSDIRSTVSTLHDMMSREGPVDLDLPNEPESDPELGFYENLAGHKEDSKEDRTQKKRVQIPRIKEPEPQRRQQTISPEKDTEQKRVAVSSKAPTDSTRPKIVDAQYTVQLASLGEKEKAEKMVSDLKRRGYPAYTREKAVKSKTYYRVNCGIFTRKGMAEDYAEELLKKQGLKGLVMRLSEGDV